jgi:hypothetical protein
MNHHVIDTNGISLHVAEEGTGRRLGLLDG